MSETRRYSAAILVVMTSCVVQLISGKTMSFDVASVPTVWQLKKFVKRSIDVPKRQQRLLDGARELTNHSPLNCSQRLTLVIVDTKCQVCDAETSAPESAVGATVHFTVVRHVSAMIGRDTGTKPTSDSIKIMRWLHRAHSSCLFTQRTWSRLTTAVHQAIEVQFVLGRKDK